MTDSLLESFVGEARELLQSSAAALLVLEKHRTDEAAINDVFRSVHTLKGSVGLFDFPAFIKLIHAAEDVLSAVRDGQLDLTSDLVDMLLDALDQTAAWVDAIAATGALAAGADGLSRDMTAGLRAALPDGYGTAQTIMSSVESHELIAPGWLATLPESDRMAGFIAAIGGTDLLAVEYVPVADCFFSGDDPFILFRQAADLYSLTMEPTEPKARIDDYEPYRCVLRFRALIGGPRFEIETLFRYVANQVRIAPVQPRDLVLLTGDDAGEPEDAAFLEAARRLAAADDWPGLLGSAEAYLQRVPAGCRLHSTLQWLRVALSTPVPDPTLVEAFIDCVARGATELHWSARQPSGAEPGAGPDGVNGRDDVDGSQTATGSGTGPDPEPFSPMAASILRSQQIIMRLPMPADGLAVRLDSVDGPVANVLAVAMRDDADAAAWSTAVGAAMDRASASPVLEVLDQWLARHDRQDLNAVVAPSPGGRAQPGAGAQPMPETRQANRVLKVDQGKIDTLMNLIGELVVSKNSLPFMARRAEEVYCSREMSREIKELHTVIDRLAQEMQNAIMAVRMLPVSVVFDRFPRLVRDVARKLGKQIDLAVEGADTAADKNIIEALNDPLLHIVRNAIDHGIEPPEDRDDVGKPARATVLLRAFQESDQVVIEVVDDGRGIDPEKIKRSAVSKGVIDEERAARLTDQEAVNLVFTPGFSTVSQISDLSGRGVGMDVVVNGVQKAGGNVAITSVKDVGTTVRLSLPLSMAVTRVMVVEACGGMLFGIPMDQIAATVRVHRDDVRRLKQSEAFVLRDAIVPLIRLDRLLGMEPLSWFGDGNEEDAVLVVRSGNSLAGLVVDRFHEGMDIILKPFDGILANIQGYSGSALLGDGRVLLVLNLKEHL